MPIERGPLLSRLSRITTSGNFIPEVDGLRAVAIGLVLMTHITAGVHASVVRTWSGPPQEDPVYRLTEKGWVGVQIFFVISGFILAIPFAGRSLGSGRRVDLRRYYLRRLTRLEPPYLAALVLAWIAAGLAWVLFPHHPPGAPATVGARMAELVPNLAASSVYLHGPLFGAVNPLNRVLWSLEVEIQFYLVMPLLATVFRIGNIVIRRGVMLCTALALTLLASAGLAGPPWFLVPHLPFFLLGFLLADLHLTGWAGAERRVAWDLLWPPVLLAGLFLPPEGARLALPVLAAATLAATLRGRVSGRVLATPWVFTVGGMCYSLYLIHQPTIYLVRKLSLKAVVSPHLGLDLLLQLAIVTPVVLLVGAIFFVLVERPCMDPTWPTKLSTRLSRVDSP